MASEISMLYKEYIIANRGVESIEKSVLQVTYWNKLLQSDFEEKSMIRFFESIGSDECKNYFQFGVDCMLSFVQANFTGPELPQSFEEFFKGSLFKVVDGIKLLSVNCEQINVNTRYPILLYAAKCIFKHCNVHDIVNMWWQWRSVLIHQQILGNISSQILSEAEILHEQIQGLPFNDDDIKAELEIEQAQFYNLCRQVPKAEFHTYVACGLLNIEYELVGKMGRRTRFQQSDTAQLTLCLKTKNNEDHSCNSTTLDYEVPKNVALQDDVLLDDLEFAEYEMPPEKLSILGQRWLLTVLQFMCVSQPQDNLYYEEVKPFIDLLLKQNNAWAIRLVTLFIRSKFEASSKRTIERSLTQCEELVNAIKRKTPDFNYRVYDVFSSAMPPIWDIENLLAHLMFSLGLVNASLDVFLRIQNWEAVIACYTELKLRHKAIEVIQEQLNKKPTVKLYCHLGSATDDITYFKKAWELSNETSFLTQFRWGLFYYGRKLYQESIWHFQKSVDINPLQPHVWLHLGYAALVTENWETAAAAYRHYTSIEPGNFETWNNLARAYIALGNNRGAHHALHEALRCNYDHWKVWDNLMYVSSKIGHFADIIRSYHRVLDAKQKNLDIGVLTVLVRGVCDNVIDYQGNPADRLLPKTRELFGRITSIHTRDPQLWELYADLSPEPFIKAQRLQRVLKGLMNPDWEKSLENRCKVLSICQMLGKLALNEEIEPANHILNSIRLNLKCVISTINRLGVQETPPLLKEIDELVPQILTKIESGN